MDNFQTYDWDSEILNEGQDFILLDEGDYDFTVSKFIRGNFNGSEKLPPCKKAVVTFTIWGRDDKIEITENFLLCNKMEWKLSQLFLSIGQKKHGEPLRMNWNAVTGARGKCHVYVDTYVKKDGSEVKLNKIKKFYAYDEQINTIQPTNNNVAPTTFSQNQPIQQATNGVWQPGTF